EKIRAEQRLLRFLEQHASVPAMREVWGAAESESVLAGGKRGPVFQSTRRPADEIVHTHHRAQVAADDLGARRHGEPFLQGPTLIGLKMAETDHPQARRVDER